MRESVYWEQFSNRSAGFESEESFGLIGLSDWTVVVWHMRWREREKDGNYTLLDGRTGWRGSHIGLILYRDIDDYICNKVIGFLWKFSNL